MGSVCCVAAKDRTITSGPAGDVLSRNIRHSPSWSFRWENRGRVAGEETSVNVISDGFPFNDRVDVKYMSGQETTYPSVNLSSDGFPFNDKVDVKYISGQETTYPSEEGSPLDSFRSVRWQKSPASREISEPSELSSSDPSDSRFHKEAEDTTLSPTISHPSPPKLSPSAPSLSSFSTSPLSSKGHPLPTGSTPRWGRLSPDHRLLRQVSDRVPGFRSPTFSISEEPSSYALPCWSIESTRGSNGGSSDSWSIPPFPEFATPHKERWSFDSESFGFVRDKIKISSGLSSGSISFDLQSCGICTKLLSEKSSFGCQKIIATELTVAAVLPCAHVYHAECLESMTSEVNKYEPLCPICTFGEKQSQKMSEKVLRAEKDLRGRRSRSRIVDGDLSSDVLVIDREKSSRLEGRGSKMSSSSSMKSSIVKPFLRRHLSFGSKGSAKSLSESPSRKRLLFWAKSSKA